jgi:hypothetical protein
MMACIVRQVRIANHLTSVINVGGNYVGFASKAAEIDHRTVIPEQRVKERFVGPIPWGASA